MFKSKWLAEHCAVVFHPDGVRITAVDLATKDLLFVWGDLMDPEFLKGLLGRYVPFGPAILPGFRRERVRSGGKWGYRLIPDSKGAMQGVVLLRLRKKDLAILDAFEEAPEVMVQTTAQVRIGDFVREAGIYMRREP